MLKELKKGQNVYFVGEKLPMIINSISENFAICTRNPNYNEDRGFIKSQSLTWSEIKKNKIYSCLDFKQNWKAPHDSWGYEISTQLDCDNALKALERGEIELSRRNHVALNIDWNLTQRD